MEQILAAGQEVDAENAEAEEEVESKGKTKKAGKKGPAKAKQPPLVSITSVVGGLSVQKQRRLLTRGCDILVATPGRLWDLCQEVSGTGVVFRR
jgi:ATP-dependent RNA helicase DDX24/MAK5